MWQKLTQRATPKEQANALRKIFRMLIAMTVINFLATVVVFIALGTAYHQRSQMNETQLSQEKLRELYIALGDTESSQRGYIITGDSGYIDAYQRNVARTTAAIEEVRKIKQSPADKATLEQVLSLSQKKLDEMQSTLEIRERDGLSAASVLVGMHLGANLMTENRQQIVAASQAMDQDIETKRTQTASITTIALAVLIVNVLATIGTAISTYRLFKGLQESNEELLNVTRSKDEFLALASHQLRTPATAVKQYLSLGLDGFAGKLTPAQREIFEKANNNNERQIAIVNDILQVTKLDLKAIKISHDRQDLARIVRFAVRDAESTIGAAGHTIHLHGTSKKYFVTVDEQYIRSAIDNLIDNAVKYSPAGGVIDVTIKKQGHDVIVSVTDHGVGIAPEDHGRLFKKFSRIDNPLSVVAGGTGLGLYWTKEIIELHEGRVTVESNRETGSTFTISLPIAR